jgi:hypothetical protein
LRTPPDRNQGAGEATVKYLGRNYQLVDPQVVAP